MTALFDNFSGPDNTDLATQVADSGSIWSRQSTSSATAGAASLAGHGVFTRTSGTSVKAYYRTDYDPGSADVQVTGTFITGTALNSQGAWVTFRGQSDNSGYGIGIGATGTISLIKIDSSGTGTLVSGLAGAPSFSAAVSTTYVFKATMRGSEIRLWINGILYNIWTETTTSATGKVGISFQGSTAATSTTGVHIDRLDADVAPALSTSALICTFDAASDGSSIFNYTSESGHHWDRHLLYAPTTSIGATVQGGALAKGSSGTEFYICDWVPGSADYPVEGQFKVRSLNSQTFYVAARADEKTTTFYYFGIQNGTTLRLGKNVSGTATSLGGSPNNSTSYTLGTTGSSLAVNVPVLAVGQTRRLRLEVTGTTLNGYVDDVLCWTVTDSAISAAGKAGVQFLGGAAISDTSTGVVLDSFQTQANAFSLATEDYRVFQMTSLSSNTTITISGQAPSTATDVQVKVTDEAGTSTITGLDWQVPTGISWTGTTWTGTISVPKGGWYQLKYRWRISGVVQATYTPTVRFGVGILIPSTGDSNQYYEYAGGTGTANALCSLKVQSSGIAQPWALQTTTGYGACLLAQLLIAEFSVPVGFLNVSQGGTTLNQWVNDNANYRTMLQTQLKLHAPVIGLFHQIGYNDYTVNGTNGGSFSLAQQVAAFASFHSSVRTACGNIGVGGTTLPIYVMGSAPGIPAKAANAPLQCQINRVAERIAGDNANNAYIISQADKSFDGTHKYYTTDGWGAHARQMARIISAILRGVTLPVLDFVDSLAVDATHTDLVLPIGSGTTAITPSSGNLDVEVGTDGTTWAAVTACVPQSRTAGDIAAGTQRVRVTHSSLSGTLRYWRYMCTQDAGYGTSGEKQVNCLRDDNSTAPMAVLMTKDAVANHQITLHVADSASATVDLATQITAFQ